MKFSFRGEICIVSESKPYREKLSDFVKEFDLFDTIKGFKNNDDLIKDVQNSEPVKERFLLIEVSSKNYISGNSLKILNEYALNTKVIYVITETNPFYLKTLFDFKPDGLIHKAERHYEIIKCIVKIRKGVTYYSSFIKDSLSTKNNTENQFDFTQREIELLTFWASNHSLNETAQMVNLSYHTVVSHRRNMFKKANCNSIEDLIGLAQSMELI